MNTTTHDVIVAQTEAATELLDYFQNHRDAIEGRLAAAESRFDVWHKDRNTLGELNAQGSRRACVFQGFISHTGGLAEQVSKQVHFTLPSAQVDAGTSTNVYLHLKTHMNTATDTQMFFLPSRRTSLRRGQYH